MKRVYIAGAYNADNAIAVIDNMRLGMQLAYKVLKSGFAPFVAWFDYHFSLIGEMTRDEYLEYSMAWLEASEAVLVRIGGSEKSRGTQAEIRRARELEIPVFYNLEGLCQWRNRFYARQRN